MKILLATDGAKHSECALQTIAKFNLNSADEIKIITVLDMALPLATEPGAKYLSSAAEIEQAAKENAKRVVAETSEKILRLFSDAAFSLTTEILIGTAETKIIEAAEKMKADLVVVGSHGYNRLERLLLGSVSDSVIRHAPCSVLVIRTAKD